MSTFLIVNLSVIVVCLILIGVCQILIRQARKRIRLLNHISLNLKARRELFSALSAVRQADDLELAHQVATIALENDMQTGFGEAL